MERTVLYQCVGERLSQWNVNVEAGTLKLGASISLPSKVQYVWPHPSGKYLYASTSDAASGNAANPGTVHRLCAVRVDERGTLSLHGDPVRLPQRPIHNSLDRTGAFAFTCYNKPSNLTVHRINSNGTIGEQIQQSSTLDFGIYAHQIVPTPDNCSVIMATRGNRPTSSKAEDPGALKVYRFEKGQLSPSADLRVGGDGGHGYGPRHLDFHPTMPWVYVSVESQNELHMHWREGSGLSGEPLFKKQTTIGTYDIRFPQAAGAIHVHPNGNTVYVSNRARGTVDYGGIKVFRGGENNIAVFSIDAVTGEPTLIQNAESQGFAVRTFSIDPSGRILVAASMMDMNVRDGGTIRHVPAALAVFQIGADGRLTFLRKYDVDLGGKLQWWTGFVNMS